MAGAAEATGGSEANTPLQRFHLGGRLERRFAEGNATRWFTPTAGRNQVPLYVRLERIPRNGSRRSYRDRRHAGNLRFVFRRFRRGDQHEQKRLGGLGTSCS